MIATLRLAPLLLFLSTPMTLSACAEEGRRWPSLEERTTLSKEDEAVLLAEWRAAKASGLLIRREEVLAKVSSDEELFRSSYCRFNNPSIIDMVAELYRIEYDYWRYYMALDGPRARKPYEEASCAQVIRPESEEDEPEMDCADLLNGVALSTFSPAIIDIAVSDYCTLSWEAAVYLSVVAPTPYMEAVLDGKLDKACGIDVLTYRFHGENVKDVLWELRRMNVILADHPDIRVRNSVKLGAFADRIKAACIHESSTKASELSLGEGLILGELEKLNGGRK